METQVNYEIQNMDEEIVEKGYVNVESVDDDEPELYIENAQILNGLYRISRSSSPELYIENAQGFYVPQLQYNGELAPIDSYIFWDAVWDHRDGELFGYEDNGYEVTINPEGK